MQYLLKGSFFIVVIIGLAGCAMKNQQKESLPATIQLQKTYYSQVGMAYEKGRYRTTNYNVGVFIPVNTAVKLVEFGSKDFVVSVENTGELIEVVNHPKHTQWTLIEAFEKLLGPEKISLLKFNAKERANIEDGTVTVGMRKAAVIVARGYPPSHETPSLQRDQWKYWNNRWDTIIVKFKNDRVVNIKD